MLATLYRSMVEESDCRNAAKANRADTATWVPCGASLRHRPKAEARSTRPAKLAVEVPMRVVTSVANVTPHTMAAANRIPSFRDPEMVACTVSKAAKGAKVGEGAPIRVSAINHAAVAARTPLSNNNRLSRWAPAISVALRILSAGWRSHSGITRITLAVRWY